MRNFKQQIIEKKIKQELSLKDGIVVVDKSSCDGCGRCIEICPQSAIKLLVLSAEDIKKLSWKGWLKMKIKGKKRADINTDLCIACGLCMKQCHEVAIYKIRK